jgi:hypothetical protein
MLKKEPLKSKYMLCIDCYHCKKKKKIIYCKKGYFNDIEYDSKSFILTPYDFECTNFEGLD